MLFSRLRPGRSKNNAASKVPKIKELDEFLESRDYTGAIALLENKQKVEASLDNELWLGYCAYHGAEYRKAAQVYDEALKRKNCPNEVKLYLACTYVMLGMIEEARKFAEQHPKSPLQNRILLHLSNKIGDDKKISYHHSILTDAIQDQLSYAAINYLRMHYANAMQTYKTLLTEHENFVALNIYLGMCYFKLQYFEEAIECCKKYLDKYPDSPTAINLQASCVFRIESPKAAEQHLKKLKHIAENELSFGKDLVVHNFVVFRNGDAALQVLPALVDVVPEARRNLIVYYLKKHDVDAAFGMAQSMEMKSSYDYLLKALVFVLLGHEKRQPANIERAAQYFKIVGESGDEKDTIIGRLSMAAYHFITGDYHSAVLFYASIQDYNSTDDSFNYNYGQANLFAENYEAAVEALMLVKNELYTNSPTYQMGLSRAFIRAKLPDRAWELYQANKNVSFHKMLLKQIANDCYLSEHYFVAAQAFKELTFRDSGNDYSVALQGAVMGTLKLFISNKVPRERLFVAIRFLERDRNPQSPNIYALARKWANENMVFE